MEAYNASSFIRDGKYHDYAVREKRDFIVGKYLKVLSKVLKPKEDILFAYIGDVKFPGIKPSLLDMGRAFNLVLFTDKRMLIGSRHLFKKTVISVPYDSIDPLEIREKLGEWEYEKNHPHDDLVVVPTKRGTLYIGFDHHSYGFSSASKAVELMALSVVMDGISKKTMEQTEFNKIVRSFPGVFDYKTLADALDDEDDADSGDEKDSSTGLTEEEQAELDEFNDFANDPNLD